MEFIIIAGGSRSGFSVYTNHLIITIMEGDGCLFLFPLHAGGERSTGDFQNASEIVLEEVGKPDLTGGVSEGCLLTTATVNEPNPGHSCSTKLPIS